MFDPKVILPMVAWDGIHPAASLGGQDRLDLSEGQVSDRIPAPAVSNREDTIHIVGYH
jgi:hypothetical protein